MKLSTIFNPINMRSQAQPGFAMTMPGIRGVAVVALPILAVFAGLLSFGTEATREFSFEVPKAEASLSIEAGVDPVFTKTQTRYIQRALGARHDNLFKLRAAAVRTAFGEPELVRADMPTIVWQYRSNNCVLDVYFKADEGDVHYAPVVFYEVRSRQTGADVNQPAEQSCFDSILPSVNTPYMLSVGAFYKSYLK
jgi:hypothetical protein